MIEKIKNSLKDPMIVILAALIVFLVCGNLFAGCNRKIVIGIDGAYGGDNTGYVGIINEADFTAKVTEKLVEKLSQDSNFTVVQSHEPNTSSSNTERVQVLSNCDMILSIHATGHPNSEKSGQKVYANIPSNANHEKSLKFAQIISDTFKSDDWDSEVGYLYYNPLEDNSYEIVEVSADDTTDYKLDTWDIMMKSDVAVVVSDQIYVTNQSDIDQWANEDGYELAAEYYYQAIKEYYGTK